MTKNKNTGIFPTSECKIIPDIFGNDIKHCNIIHANGAGAKTSLAYLYWKETGDLSVWEDLIIDNIVMSLDDLACVGAIDIPLVLSSVIERNKHLIPKEIILILSKKIEYFIQKMQNLGIKMYSTSGETGDISNLVQTIVLNNTLACRMKRKNVIEKKIKANDVIVGLASSGQAAYENQYNSGIGINGLTYARHNLLSTEYYNKYPELQTDPKYKYSGSYKITDKIPSKYFENQKYDAPKDIGKLMLSPTRTFTPVINEIIYQIRPGFINGIINCGFKGQTKVLDFAEDNVHIIKDNLFTVPPIFNLIKDTSDYNNKEMYQKFNMGHRIEIYLPEKFADIAIKIAQAEEYGIEAKIIGRVEASEKKKLTISDDHGTYIYE